MAALSASSGRPPQLGPEAIAGVVSEHYNFTHLDTASVKQLNSYYDSNFSFEAVLNNESRSKFVFKIMNSMRMSEDLAIGITALWQHLNSKGFTFTEPIANKHRKLVTVVTLNNLLQFQNESTTGNDRVFCTRVMRFVEGEIFDAVDKTQLTPELMFDVGEYIGKIDIALQDFRSPVIEMRENKPWNQQYLPDLQEQLPLLEDTRKQEMVETVLKGYRECVLPLWSDFRKGVIYSDPSGQNTIIFQNKVAGMIDFDDVCFSSYVVDLGVALAYIMMENLSPQNSTAIEFVAPIVHGYNKSFPLSEKEMKSLYYVMLARCCQSAVSGEVCYKSEPWNEYLLTTPAKSWKVIELLLATGKDAVDKIWASTIED